MSDQNESEKTLPIITVNMPDAELGNLLLEGKLVAYRDSRYGVSSGDHQIVMKLSQYEDQFVLFYLHIPYAYPIPDGVKDTVKLTLETILKTTLKKIEYINVGTEAEKKDIQFRMELGDEIK